MTELLTHRQLPDEFRLVAACCRWPASEERNAAIRNAAGSAVDWTRLLKMARRHRVQSLVHHGLASAGISPPPDISGPLKSDAAQIAHRNLMMAAECVRLKQTFDSADTPLLFVKGISLAALAYGTLSLKMGWDIDVLIEPDHLQHASDLLGRAGYERTIPSPRLSQAGFIRWHDHSKESVWKNDRSGIFVELHTRLSDNRMLLPTLRVDSARQQAEIAPDTFLPTLATDGLFSYLCVHGASSAWFRLKWIADLAALLAPMSPEEVGRLHRKSQLLGAGRSSAQALLLCVSLFDLKLPGLLDAELNASAVNRRLARSALNLMAGRSVDRELDLIPAGTVPIHLTQFFLLKGWRYKIRELHRQSIDPFDWARLRLPRGLHLAYPIGRMGRWVLNKLHLRTTR